MNPWTPRRNSQYEHSFDLKLAALSISAQDFEAVAVGVDEALCGATADKLDELYPPLVGNLRLYRTDAAQNVPALRIAFRLEQGTITYVDVDPR